MDWFDFTKNLMGVICLQHSEIILNGTFDNFIFSVLLIVLGIILIKAGN